MERLDLPARASRLGARLGARLETLRQYRNVADVRGRGLLWGVELNDAATARAVVTTALRNGVLLLASGVDGASVAIAPPLVIEERDLDRATDVIEAGVRDAA
jgi:4-aminobutyrate aminotransferase-like enzyme